MPDILRVLVLIPTITLHSSLQHEFLHGHPFRNQKLNDLLIAPPIGVLVPYLRFKSCHLTHHINENITDPYDDPESYYLDRTVWATLPAWFRSLLVANNTLVGRITLGPALATVGFLRSEYVRAKAGDRAIPMIWLRHILAVVLLFWLISSYGSLPPMAYFIAAYFGMGLLMVRSFLEHQAVEKTNQRSVIIETRGPLSLLFLNNNFHSVHHAYPSLAWYRIPAFFRENRERFLRMNGGYRYESYWEVFRRFAFRPKEPVAWPIERQRKRRGEAK
ncbi:MAG: fatty acid desaturase [Hoeflea sp.]|uniref:fatty acid desaturase n=1 Tax=Hoeflea sp. TaxID=1940281 RepID=UPI001D22BF17|nr:fatty acid desaturase [Hoeflea sp.]MBU4528265.1 fatty acid desaturase [Alphaproteobacteria bacterium]MBU4543861.1 fatty acid desaturase [Alphaproteobacteria bacterium]MBU4548502.1 fatty acid desaturase [Alphaproteobacteria bacterium]MBV1722581.1 fatty acid desaturase [Hoeflea sp.]MBV1762250.1 fatty acid desaturase [Hoeflea sp.]